MSHWNRLSRRSRALYLALAALILATTAWASRAALPDWDEAAATTSPSSPADLKAPLPPPAEVLLQKTSAFPDRGNALVMVRLTPQQLAAKQADGTRSFITLGDLGHQVILRDDGQQGDSVSGDGLFTGIAHVDENGLAARAAADQNAIKNGAGSIPRFEGRTIMGQASQEPFDFGGFEAGRAVRLQRSVVRVTSASSAQSTGFAKATPSQFAERVLMIRDVAVVRDPSRTIDPCTGFGNPNGVWTFNHLITEMANQTASGIDPSLFAENWLQNWTINQTINSFPVPSRLQMQSIINQWRTESGGGRLDLTKAPVRLLAIVSRVDLRRTTAGGGSYGPNVSGNFLDAGEARFIFGLVLKPGWQLQGGYSASNAPVINSNGCQALPFSIIFEYRVPKCHCESVVAWARDWVDLNNWVPGTPDYNDRLERLTEQFVRANANPTRPNGSAIGQIRSNEIALARPWQLREFQLTQFPWSLANETTTADTAADVFNNGGVFNNWVLTQIVPLLAGPNWDQPIPQVPLFFLGGNFLGARPEVPNPGFFWNAPGLNLANPAENWGRHRASLNSCNGCHAGETSTPFVHVDPSTPGLPANLSGFLTGIVVNDPAFGAPARPFNDLARREADIQQVAALSCVHMATANVAQVQASLRATGQLPADLFAGTPPPSHDDFLSVAVDDMIRNVVLEVH
ncbi:MAG TPA: choice-of-anchor X domain-containing protein [Thermoanaerobaculia bacterium]|nr:choice-of-anchor X domain-containing protein [Thermoanaerobaculia bacterium]